MAGKLSISKETIEKNKLERDFDVTFRSKKVDTYHNFPKGKITNEELDDYAKINTDVSPSEIEEIEIGEKISSIDEFAFDRFVNIDKVVNKTGKDDILDDALYGFKVLFEKSEKNQVGEWERITEPFEFPSYPAGDLKIYDLMQGGYSDMYSLETQVKFKDYVSRISHLSHYYAHIISDKNSLHKNLLKDIPVFLVDSSMGGKEINVPSTDYSIRVPNEPIKSTKLPEKFDIETWSKQMIEPVETDNVPEPEPEPTENGYLGMYVSDGSKDTFGGPRRIFIWMDRIKESAKEDGKSKDIELADAVSLFHAVFCHEMAHALMDVELYGLKHNDKFKYDSDVVYRIYEEAYAESIALQVLDESGKGITQIIKDSVMKGGNGYSSGWQLYKHKSCNLNQWLAIKILFNNNIARFIQDSFEIYFNGKNNVIAPSCYRCKNGKIEVRDGNN